VFLLNGVRCGGEHETLYGAGKKVSVTQFTKVIISLYSKKVMPRAFVFSILK
jgi:hypothetical protein